MSTNLQKHLETHCDKRSDKNKNLSHTQQLTENEVYITEYVSKLGGFSGIIKARFSDFHVNEINLNGEIAKLTDRNIPKNFRSAEKTESEELTLKEKRHDNIPESIWDQIIKISEFKDEIDEQVSLDADTFTKEERANIHKHIKQVFGKKIVASTVQKEGKKILLFKKYNKNDAQDFRNKWPENRGEYVHFIVYKEMSDTLDASFQIGKCLKINPSKITYAGVKDKRAKTTQWFCIKKVEPWKLFIKTKHLKNIKIGNVTFKDSPLKLGQLQGNQFRVALRNVTVEDGVIDSALKFLSNKGFINYYGLQRFGNHKEVPTFLIGIKLLQGNWKEACNLILKPKSSDDPNSILSKAKLLYQETCDAKIVVEKFFKNTTDNCIESKLLVGLAKLQNNDYVNALETIPRNMRLLYLHAFQSLIWNKIVSQRIKKFGFSVLEGDLVINSDLKVENPCEITNSDENHSSCENVKVLVSQDLPNYTIDDIVLPLPGYDIVYPNNEIRDWYKLALEEHGLALDMPKQKVKTYTLSGIYRKIIGKVKNLSWKIMKYDNPKSTLIQSDFEEFLKHKEPEDLNDGKYKALVLKFCLDSSCYATMMLREILKIDTSGNLHSSMNNYYECENNTADCLKTESLLSNPDQYELFKQTIFCSGETTLKRKMEIEEKYESKKNKTDNDSNKESFIPIQ